MNRNQDDLLSIVGNNICKVIKLRFCFDFNLWKFFFNTVKTVRHDNLLRYIKHKMSVKYLGNSWSANIYKGFSYYLYCTILSFLNSSRIENFLEFTLHFFLCQFFSCNKMKQWYPGSVIGYLWQAYRIDLLLLLSMCWQGLNPCYNQ